MLKENKEKKINEFDLINKRINEKIGFNKKNKL